MDNVFLPSSAAVHTRSVHRDQDYDWYVKTKNLQFFEKINDIYRLTLRDVSDKAPGLVIIITSLYSGFLIANMPSERVDFDKRTIYNTLYLEFDKQPSILEVIINLLICADDEYKQYEQYFVHYAEHLYKDHENISLPLEFIELPILDKPLRDNLAVIEKSNMILYSTFVNRSRCAKYLRNVAVSGDEIFCFISTGNVSINECKQAAEHVDQCLILTLSHELLREVELKKKNLKDCSDNFLIPTLRSHWLLIENS